MSIVSNYNRFSPRHHDVHCHGADEGKDGQTAEDPGRHADHGGGIVFGCGVVDYRRPWMPCGPC